MIKCGIINILVGSLFFQSCAENQGIKTSELNSSQIIPAGEWQSQIDSSAGISIREDKIAFYKKMTFTSDDIYKYKIIDTVESKNGIRKNVHSYLFLYDESDTISYKIEKRNESILILEHDNKSTETYRLKNKK